jgi:nucleotide-binding universal stress UspA family protein
MSHAVAIRSIFHPSDFSEASEIAFVHALKLALVAKASLSMLHVTAGSKVGWQDFPGVHDTLERWRLVAKGSPKSAVGRLGIDIQKILMSSRDPVKACLNCLAKHPADLIVLAVRHREGRMRWLQRSVGEPMAHRAGQITLFLPQGVKGFVSRQDGSVRLRSILISVAKKPRAQPAMEATVRLIRNFQLSAGAVTCLHVGSARATRLVKLPATPGWTWNCVSKTGEPAETILETAAEVAADLIVMTTDGPDGFLDGLRGTTSERVLRKARCAVANLPAGSMLG